MQECEFQISSGTFGGLTNGGNGQVVLGLHGFLDNAASLLPLAPAFDDYQFIALDLPGHGKSFHRSESAHYNQMDYIQDIHELVLTEQWRDIIIVGHSLGGILASIYAAVFPEYVRAIAMIDACGPLTMPESSTAGQLKTSILSRMPKPVKSPARKVDLEAAIKARCSMTDTQPEHARMILQRNIKELPSGECTWRSDPRLRTKSTLRLTEGQAENLMSSITCPVWIGGAKDSFKEMEATYAKRKSWLKNSHFELFSGGHHFHMVNPTAVHKAITRFVEEM